MPNKTGRGDPLGFFNIHSVAKFQKKTERGTLWEIFFPEKSLAMPKLRGGTLQSCSVLYVTREIFWLGSVDQRVQFGDFKFLKFW